MPNGLFRCTFGGNVSTWRQAASPSASTHAEFPPFSPLTSGQVRFELYLLLWRFSGDVQGARLSHEISFVSRELHLPFSGSFKKTVHEIRGILQELTEICRHQA